MCFDISPFEIHLCPKFQKLWDLENGARVGIDRHGC